MVRALAGVYGPELVHRRGPLGSEGGLVHEGHRRGPPQAPVPLADRLGKLPSGDGRAPPCAAAVLQCPLLPPPPTVDQALIVTIRHRRNGTGSLQYHSMARKGGLAGP